MIFSAQDKQRIEKAIAEVEAHSATEIVVGSVISAEDYSGLRSVVGAVAGLLCAFILSIFAPAIPIHWLLLAQLPPAVLFWWLAARGPVVRLFMPNNERRQNVERRALLMFSEHGISNTRDRSGLLILLAERERQAVILGVTGIHERVGNEGWQEHLTAIIGGIKNRRAGDAVTEVIESLGVVLKRDFPRREGDTNEPKNRVIEER